jgi:hypothetical protein
MEMNKVVVMKMRTIVVRSKVREIAMGRRGMRIVKAEMMKIAKRNKQERGRGKKTNGKIWMRMNRTSLGRRSSPSKENHKMRRCLKLVKTIPERYHSIQSSILIYLSTHLLSGRLLAYLDERTYMISLISVKLY